jgi:hypothetical protein
MELTFESKFSHHHLNKELFLEYVLEVFIPAVKAIVSFQDVEESWQFYFATTVHVTARMRFYGISRLMEFF